MAALVKLASMPDFDNDKMVGTSAVFRSSRCWSAGAFPTIQISIAIWARKPSSDLDRGEGTASVVIDNGEVVGTSAERGQHMVVVDAHVPGHQRPHLL